MKNVKRMSAVIAASCMFLSTTMIANASDEACTLKFWITNNLVSAEELEMAEEDRYISKAIERFQEQYPNVEIEVTNYGDDETLLSNYKAAVLAGEGPDILLPISGPTLMPLVDTLVPLNDYLDADHLDNMAGWETCSANMDPTSTIYAIPYCGQSIVCFAYNKSLVAAAGLDFENDPPRTIDAFYAALDAIKETGVTPFHCDESWPEIVLYDLGLWWEQLSGTDALLAHNFEKTLYAEDEGFLFMLDEYKKFYENGWVNEDTATSADQYSYFMQGKSAIHPFGVWSLDDFRDALGDDLGIMAIPSAIEEDVAISTAIGGCGACLCVPSFSENQEIAVEFAKFLTTKDELTQYYQKYITIPIRTDIVAADFGKDDDPLYSQLVDMSAGIYYWPDNCISTDAASIYYQMLCQVLVGNMEPMQLAEMMDEAQED